MREPEEGKMLTCVQVLGLIPKLYIRMRTGIGFWIWILY